MITVYLFLISIWPLWALAFDWDYTLPWLTSLSPCIRLGLHTAIAMADLAEPLHSTGTTHCHGSLPPICVWNLIFYISEKMFFSLLSVDVFLLVIINITVSWYNQWENNIKYWVNFLTIMNFILFVKLL